MGSGRLDADVYAEMLTGPGPGPVLGPAAGGAERVHPEIRQHLRIALFQIRYLTRIPRHAAVNEAVELAKGVSARSAGFVNAVLRKLKPPAVNPAKTPNALAERWAQAPLLVVGPGVKTGIPIRYDDPREVGPDRIVHSVAAKARFGAPVIVVDFGTSTNFDVVSGAGEYLGGVIGPGVEISLEALTSRTAKLPRIDLSAPEEAIGKHTQAAIQSGFAYGFAGLVDGINRRLGEELGEKATFIATGGFAHTIAPHCETIDDVDELLTLRGLELIYELNT